MKRLIVALTVAFLFVAGSALAATINCVMYASENNGTKGTSAGNAGPTITADYTFTIQTDGSGNVTNFTNLWDGYFHTSLYKTWASDTSNTTYTKAGYDPRFTPTPPSTVNKKFSPGELVFAHNEMVNVAKVSFDGVTTGGDAHGLWFLGQANTSGPLGGQVFGVGLLNYRDSSQTLPGIQYYSATGYGVAAFGPNVMYEEIYQFHSVVPIPAAAWLLLSGLVGIVGLRKRS